MVPTYLLCVALAAQSPSRDSLMADGVRLALMQPAAAAVRFEAVLARDSTDAEANWRAAISLTDVSLPLTAKPDRERRDSLLARAELLARRGVRIAPASAWPLFTLGYVLGTEALTRGSRERLRLATEIRSLALRAIAADSLHDGAQHLLGRWNYEAMRLSGFQRFIAKNILGGGVLGEASWAEAEERLERAVAIDTARIYHRLDLARVLVERDNPAKARQELQTIARLPNRVAADSIYRREAVELLARLHPS